MIKNKQKIYKAFPACVLQAFPILPFTSKFWKWKQTFISEWGTCGPGL